MPRTWVEAHPALQMWVTKKQKQKQKQQNNKFLKVRMRDNVPNSRDSKYSDNLEKNFFME